MPRSLNLARPMLLFGVAIAVALALPACRRKPAPPSARADATTAAVPAPTSPAALAPPGSAVDEPPEGVLRAYVWECRDGQTLRMRNLYREQAVAIDFHEGTQRLDQVASASGVRYANPSGSIAFSTRGGAATLERAGSAAVQCSELRPESLAEDARQRGVVYRAVGNEPGWILEIGPRGRLDWTTDYGQDAHAYDGAIETAAGSDAAAGRVYTASARGSAPIKVTVRAEACTDDAGVAFDHTATIEYEGGTLRGCARHLN